MLRRCDEAMLRVWLDISLNIKAIPLPSVEEHVSDISGGMKIKRREAIMIHGS